jgi:hypothetical protein
VEDTVTIDSLTKMFENADTLTREARETSEKCRDYYDGNQFTAAEIAIFESRNQPPIVNNRIQPMVDFLSGIELRSRTDPKAYPRTINPESEKDAEAATDALRFVADNNFFDNMASEVFEMFMLEGPAGVSVEVEKRGKKREIVLRKIAFNRFFFDPYSVDKQFRDANYTGLVAWMDIDEIVDRWELSKADEKSLRDSAESYGAVSGSETYDDVPRWFDRQDRNRSMVVEIYFRRKGKWHHAIFAKDVWLVKPEVSKYLDDEKEPENPHVVACPKISRHGEHYGPVKTRLSMQDDINKRHSRSTDLLVRRQTFAKEGAISDINKFKREANTNGGHIEFPQGPGRFGEDYGFVPNESLGLAEHQLYQFAITQIESLARAGIAADNESNMSGKALGKLQSSRNLEIQPLVEVFSMWKIRVYRAIWNRVRQFWTDERWIRVTDDESNARFVGLNRPELVRDLVQDKLGAIPELFERSQNINLDQPTFGEGGRPARRNEVSKMDVDIFIEEVPDITSLQEETFEQLVQLYQADPSKIPWEKIVKMSPLRSRQKEEILGSKEQPNRQQIAAVRAKQQAAQEVAEIEKADRIAKVRKTAAEGAKKVSETRQTELENRILEQFPIRPTNLSI